MIAPSGAGPPHYGGFTITLRHNTLGRTPLHEWSAQRTNLYLTTHNTHNRQTDMPPARFEPAILASERPQTHVLCRAVTGIVVVKYILQNPFMLWVSETELLVVVNCGSSCSRHRLWTKFHGILYYPFVAYRLELLYEPPVLIPKNFCILLTMCTAVFTKYSDYFSI